MLINMWGTGELKREFKVLDAKIYMRITRPLEPMATPVCIMLDNAHVYYPSSQDELFYYMPVYSVLAHEHLRLPNDLSSIRRFVDYVQDGFDELLKTAPEEQDREKQIYGEMEATFGDTKIVKEVSK